MLGALATGVFASVAINPAGANGLLYGNVHQFLVQVLAVVVSAGYSAIGTFVILKLVDLTIGLRVDESEELAGLDTSQHGELAYQL